MLGRFLQTLSQQRICDGQVMEVEVVLCTQEDSHDSCFLPTSAKEKKDHVIDLHEKFVFNFNVACCLSLVLTLQKNVRK